MSFLKKRFGKESKSFKFVQEEVRAKSESEQIFIKRIHLYHDKKEYKLALEELLLFLNEHPERDQFVLFAAATVLRSYLRHIKTASVFQAIPDSILWDKRLDPVFMSCSSCHSYWVPSPSSNFYVMTGGTTNKSTCPNCGKKSIRVGMAEKIS